jgi:hypothetical protein
MLQYPIPLPPLSLRSKDNVPDRDNGDRDRRRNLSTKRLKNDNVFSGSPAFAAFSHPHAIPVVPKQPSISSPQASPNLPPHSTISPSSPHSRFLPTKQIHPGPVSRPQKIDIPSHSYTPKSSRPSTATSAVADIFFPGDLIGEDLSLQGEQIRLVPFTSRARHTDGNGYEEPAKEFEIVRLLGTGSYAVVYLVREVLSRRLPSEDEHSPLGRLEIDDRFARRPSFEYGREYAIKCLSKANLDQEALATQTFEARPSLPSDYCISLLNCITRRLLSINLFLLIQIL